MHSPSPIFLVAQGLNSKPPRCGCAASGTEHFLSDSELAARLSNAGTADGGQGIGGLAGTLLELPAFTLRVPKARKLDLRNGPPLLAAQAKVAPLVCICTRLGLSHRLWAYK